MSKPSSACPARLSKASRSSIELNLRRQGRAGRSRGRTIQAALSVKDAQELLALQAGLIQPAAEKAAAYSRHVYDIAASTGAEVGRVAEAQAAEAQAKFMAVVDNAVKNAPAGTENAVALVKSAVAAANNAFESCRRPSSKPSTSPKRTSTPCRRPPSAPPRRRRPELTLMKTVASLARCDAKSPDSSGLFLPARRTQTFRRTSPRCRPRRRRAPPG